MLPTQRALSALHAHTHTHAHTRTGRCRSVPMCKPDRLGLSRPSARGLQHNRILRVRASRALWTVRIETHESEEEERVEEGKEDLVGEGLQRASDNAPLQAVSGQGASKGRHMCISGNTARHIHGVSNVGKGVDEARQMLVAQRLRLVIARVP